MKPRHHWTGADCRKPAQRHCSRGPNLAPVRQLRRSLIDRTTGAAHRTRNRARSLCRAQTFAPSNDASARGGEKNADNPIDQDVEIRLANLRCAARCRAMTRAGTPCQRPALRGRKRCRLHGGLSPGAPRGFKNGNFRNGSWTADAIEERKWLRSPVQLFATTG
jgi:hypothetical protein